MFINIPVIRHQCAGGSMNHYLSELRNIFLISMLIFGFMLQFDEPSNSKQNYGNIKSKI